MFYFLWFCRLEIEDSRFAVETSEGCIILRRSGLRRSDISSLRNTPNNFYNTGVDENCCEEFPRSVSAFSNLFGHLSKDNNLKISDNNDEESFDYRKYLDDYYKRNFSNQDEKIESIKDFNRDNNYDEFLSEDKLINDTDFNSKSIICSTNKFHSSSSSSRVNRICDFVSSYKNNDDHEILSAEKTASLNLPIGSYI